MPDAPTAVSASPADSSAVVTFTPPAANGGSPVTSFTATSSPGSVTGTCTAPCTTITVTGLTNGISYTFTVTATNAAGTGPASAPSNSIMPGPAPDAPSGVSATAGNAQAYVTFAVPASGANPVTGYVVVSNPAGGVDTNAGASVTKHVLTGLANGIDYTFTVTATNIVGTSPASSPSNTVTPATALAVLDGAHVRAGSLHTCAAMTGGDMRCWGDSTYGQIGDGTRNTRVTPAKVSGLSGVTAIGVGAGHTCTVDNGGAVLCWGANDSGQLGTGDFGTYIAPTQVSGIASGATAVALGASHTCALMNNGAVTCWGSNSRGQLGSTSGQFSTTPIEYTSLGTGITAIATGSEHTCAIGPLGGIACWGRGAEGEIGDGTTNDGPTARRVIGMTSGIAAITAGLLHTCGLTNAGAVKCWGDNTTGQLGDGSTTRRVTPVPVTGLASGISAIAAGAWHTCALTNPGGVVCWGDNSAGQLGDNSLTQRTTPVPVVGLDSGVVSIAAGDYHTCAVLNTGEVRCWGSNGHGQLGDRSADDTWTPVGVLAGTPGAPTNVAASPGNAQAQVTFVPPTDDGDSPILGYSVTSSPAGGVDSGAGTTSTTRTISGLHNGTTYTFRVTATNAIGAGTISAASNPIVPTAGSVVAPTTTSLASSANPASVGSSVTFTATVTGTAPTGTVQFLDGASAISGCTAIALAGTGDSKTAACSTAALAIGTHSITATYGGDAGNAVSTSNSVSQVIDPPSMSFANLGFETPDLGGSYQYAPAGAGWVFTGRDRHLRQRHRFHQRQSGGPRRRAGGLHPGHGRHRPDGHVRFGPVRRELQGGAARQRSGGHAGAAGAGGRRQRRPVPAAGNRVYAVPDTVVQRGERRPHGADRRRRDRQRLHRLRRRRADRHRRAPSPPRRRRCRARRTRQPSAPRSA